MTTVGVISSRPQHFMSPQLTYVLAVPRTQVLYLPVCIKQAGR
jgi:hypothetical protein